MMKKQLTTILAACVLLTGPVVLTTGCNTSQQRLAYNTLWSVETTVVKAYDVYLELVWDGHIKPDDMREVAKVFNRYQTEMQAVIAIQKLDWSAPAPEHIVKLASEVLAAIARAKGNV